MKILNKYSSFYLALSLMVCSGQIYALDDAVTDIRTVIDVSGSMKKNDPVNLRAPALKLLVELMPQGTRSGVWTFGQYVNMNVKHGKVDASWKKRARAEASKIHSRGLYTNIEEALRKASFGWTKPNAGAKRSLILLTDGVVDISKDTKLNALSRQRIIEELLPQLKKARVKVHTVALSKDADHQLLKEISGLTGGWYERVDNAAQLQKVFLRLFEKSASVDTLPIKENKFLVDKHVKDMTLVLFHSKKSKPAKIITPDKKTISKIKHASNIHWYQERGYELITIKKPKAGEWQLQTEVDPDNRVMVVTNLRLKVNSLPNTLLSEDELTIKARLTEEGKTITRNDFLKLVEFKLVQDPKKGYVLDTNMHDDGKNPDELNQDGIYSAHLDNSLSAGQHMLSVKVTGPTFKREFRHLLQIVKTPAEIKITKNVKGDFKLVLMPHSDILQLSTVSAQAKLPDGKVKTFTQDKTNEWLVTIAADYQNKIAEITLIATRMDDKPLKLKFERILAVSGKKTAISMTEKVKPIKEGSQSEEKAKVELPAKEEHAEAKPEDKLQADKHKKDKPEVKDEEDEEFDWIFVTSMTLIINILALIVGYFGYKYWKKRSAAKDVEEDSEIAL